ncbi:hypothetical protein Glove_184g52 [Diversispora epigaea]|uniref:Cas12f1-like TNB domain-containing protein n=1 Tax=Diversispora epigaea TaxID=1348612 RepID=A0A397IWE4_9GLOM|nr:hypothetical protein Glove_184g52 [Diversispora epigaea]
MTSNIRKRPRSAMSVISTENETNTHRRSRKSGGCPKRPLVLLWIQTHRDINHGSQFRWLPKPLEIRTETQEKEGSGVIALDPGVRTFMSGYDPSGIAIVWGKNDIGRIYRLSYKYDKLQSKLLEKKTSVYVIEPSEMTSNIRKRPRSTMPVIFALLERIYTGVVEKVVDINHGSQFRWLPKPLEIRTETQEKEGSGVIALDPGVRTFMSGYDPSGIAIVWGKNDIGRIYRLSYKYDKLQSKLLEKKTSVYVIDDCHHKLSKWLCKNYRVILLPEFCTQGMIRHGQRRIRSKTARAMCTWSHYRFRQHLINKAREHPWCQIVVCTEEYTSKTCGFCGYIHEKLGGSKEFCCPQCKTKIDRDINGARNILLKYLTKKESA